ncbi:hypothetical protein [Halopseudomonas pelagia]|uniref:Energy transducer TonB n=1 Tax=Halopseudomonas pelagia TaxID=553151 RepID=A0AA91U6Y7_9GAMM|nr:hypothetical protein [Halopseudomonas pelagia]PCD01324.1 hypothetical protein CO192_00360 [Halopseudomonas pelagia]QFY55774.1 hypothetical protein EAO82_05020 [Halopseudomonas pelagia]
MRESVRLAYLEAMGVTGWVPMQTLAHAALRSAPEPELPVENVQQRLEPALAKGVDVVVDTVSAEQPTIVSAERAAVPAPRKHELPRVSPPKPATLPTKIEPEEEKTVAPAVELTQVAPFYLQLWMAGPCALLIETPDPGIEKGTPHYNLLGDILRAAQLPTTPQLHADFRWPLSRNPQVARSAAAASEALQAFMQARLELAPVSSIGCFGVAAGLLAESDPQQAEALCGREEALEGLAAAWFAPDLQTLMQKPQEKARLWHLLKRVMPRWQDRA